MQMRIFLGEGYSSEHQKLFRGLIFCNIFDHVQCLIRGMELLNLEYSDDLDMENVEIVRSLNLYDLYPEQVDERYWIAAENIWKDSGIQICYQRRNEFPLGDNVD
jgi:hypothetical protein